MKSDLIGRSKDHQDLLETLRKVSPTDAEILICGPSGSGKELYAQFIHDHSHRSGKALVPINCGSLEHDLLENVMFGHVGGAFTGATTQTEGLVHAAEGGTLFLDEVDTLPMACQVKLLRFLQDRTYRRLGETQLRRADVRIVAACNGDLVAAINENRFRQDLFFRLRVIPITIEPLVNRLEDLEDLLTAFIQQTAGEYDLPPIRLAECAFRKMKSYPWPGNVRELQNCVRYLTCLQPDGPIIAADLPLIDWDGVSELDEAAEPQLPSQTISIDRPLKEVKNDFVGDLERGYIQQILTETSGNISEAARRSGKARRAFFELMRKHHVDPEPYRKAVH